MLRDKCEVCGAVLAADVLDQIQHDFHCGGSSPATPEAFEEIKGLRAKLSDTEAKLAAAEAELAKSRLNAGRTIAAIVIAAGGKVRVSYMNQIEAGTSELTMEIKPMGDIIFAVRAALAQ